MCKVMSDDSDGTSEHEEWFEGGRRSVYQERLLSQPEGIGDIMGYNRTGTEEGMQESTRGKSHIYRKWGRRF